MRQLNDRLEYLERLKSTEDLFYVIFNDYRALHLDKMTPDESVELFNKLHDSFDYNFYFRAFNEHLDFVWFYGDIYISDEKNNNQGIVFLNAGIRKKIPFSSPVIKFVRDLSMPGGMRYIRVEEEPDDRL